MKKHTVVQIFVVISMILCSCSVNEVARSTNVATQTNTPTVTLTPSSTLTPTLIPTVTKTPIHPLNSIVFHDANKEIPWRWFSYIPSVLDKTRPVYILVTGLHGAGGTYDDSTSTTKSMLQERIGWPEINNFVLLAPVIPRIENTSQGEIYSIAFDLPSFETSDEFSRRADLKVNSIIDEFSRQLRSDGFIVNDKFLIEGFSAGAMFAQRYALLHPENVLAIVAGQCGGNFTLPITSYNNTTLNWPVGVNDLANLSQLEFNEIAYKEIHQFIYIGSQDSKVPNTILFPNEWGATNMWQSVSQRVFLRRTFGVEDPVRMSNEIEYLRNNGFQNIEIKIYPGVGHQETNEMINDKMIFLMRVIDPAYVRLPTPSPSFNIVVDGFGDDWMGITGFNERSGDAPSPDTDIIAYSYIQDGNFIDIMVQTNAPITNETATLDIGLSLKSSNGETKKFEFNIKSDGSAWGGNSPEEWHRIPGALIAWNNVVEIQIPKSVFQDSMVTSVNYISLFTNLDGKWTVVDTAP